MKKHKDSCASLCTNYNNAQGKSDAGCDIEHFCWCEDGGLSYAEWNAKHRGRVEGLTTDAKD